MAFLDSFTGTSGTKLNTRTGWAQIGSGSGTQIPEINASNQLKAAAATDDVPLVGQTSVGVDHYVQANVYTGFCYTSGAMIPQLMVRATTRGTSFGVGYGTSSGAWWLISNNGGIAASATRAFVSGDLVRIEAVGSAIRVYVNGTKVIDYTATDRLTNTNVGVLVAGTAGSDPVMDNYESGSLVATVPGPPTDVIATAGTGTVSVAFTAPSSNGGSAITGYTATWSGGQSATGTGSPIVISGVTAGVAGTATVTATNAVGTSAASTASNSVTPTAPPSPPTGVYSRVEADGDTVYVEITTTNTPTSGTISLPVASSNPGGAVAQGPTSLTLSAGLATATWTNVPAGSYDTPVATLTNGGGVSSVTGGNGVTIAGISANPDPGTGGGTADTNLPIFTGGITASGQTVNGFTLSWGAATDDTGVTGYEINNGAGYVDLGLVLTTSLTGKAPSTTYTGSVRAYDAAGNRSIPQNYSATTADPPVLPPPAMGGNTLPGKRGFRRQRRG